MARHDLDEQTLAPCPRGPENLENGAGPRGHGGTPQCLDPSYGAAFAHPAFVTTRSAQGAFHVETCKHHIAAHYRRAWPAVRWSSARAGAGRGQEAFRFLRRQWRMGDDRYGL